MEIPKSNRSVASGRTVNAGFVNSDRISNALVIEVCLEFPKYLIEMW